MLPERETLSELRLSQAKQCLVSAEALLQINDERGAVNRAYYAVFHAIRSVLILEARILPSTQASYRISEKNTSRQECFLQIFLTQ